jgi:hypothetical protein
MVNSKRSSPLAWSWSFEETLLALGRAAATFETGKLVERPDEHPQPEAAQKIFIHRS